MKDMGYFENYTHFENLSVTAGIGIMLLDVSGKILYESSLYSSTATFLDMLYEKLDCKEDCHISFLYGCYQARRFGGRYIFFAPSDLVYCAAPLLSASGKMLAGILAGPFLINDHDDFIHYYMQNRHTLTPADIDAISEGVRHIVCKTPSEARCISEHLYYVASAYFSQVDIANSAPVQANVFYSQYPVEKEDELLSAIAKGDIHSANMVLSEMLKHIMLSYGGNVEELRSRVVELTVLLSRAALKGGADVNAILGLNYDYLREIDSISSAQDMALWLQTVMRRFTQHVFDFAGAKHMDVIYKAVDYIKRNYAGRLTLQDISDHLLISLQHFCRIFKDATGQTPGKYITFVRVEESKKLLRNSAVNIADIPELVGFDSQSYFTTIFKKETGQTPGRYRRENTEVRGSAPL